MGTVDEHKEIPIEDREVLEDLGEGTHPRGLLPATCKHSADRILNKYPKPRTIICSDAGYSLI